MNCGASAIPKAVDPYKRFKINRLAASDPHCIRSDMLGVHRNNTARWLKRSAREVQCKGNRPSVRISDRRLDQRI